MREQLDNVIDTIKGSSGQPGHDIREAAHKMSRIAIESYEGYLLKSALSMVAAVAQFAEDLGRLYNEPTAGKDDNA